MLMHNFTESTIYANCKRKPFAAHLGLDDAVPFTMDDTVNFVDSNQC